MTDDLTPHQRAVAMVAAAYPTPAWAPATLRAYAELLEDLDAGALQLSVVDWIRSRAERPTIADLRRAVSGRQAIAAESPYLDPDEAWAHVEWAITKVGGYRDFPDTHPLVAETVRAIGWQTLCQSDNAMADRAHFLQLYRGRLERAKRGDATNPGARPLAALGLHAVPERLGLVGSECQEDRP